MMYFLFLSFLSIFGQTESQKPHIIFIVADDLGWNDVSFHGSAEIPTPNIDALAFNGVVLNTHYVLPTGTATRAALMTGKYPIHLGMQGYSLSGSEPWGLPPYKILPQYLKDLGYTTRMVGKWNLGHYKKSLTPTYRGFDSYLGSWTRGASYYDYIHQETVGPAVLNGFDLRRNLELALDKVGHYATDLFTDEAVRIIHNHIPKSTPLFLYVSHMAAHSGNKGKLLEAPQKVVERFQHIADPNRRTYAAMVSKLDESVGRIVNALQTRGMLSESIIVFLSDNGSPTVAKAYQNWGSNYPFRGVKETAWEGAVRGSALIWSPILQQTPRVSEEIIHISDWLPTLYTAAGGTAWGIRQNGDIDGIDQWNSLVYSYPSPRQQVLINIDERQRSAAIRVFGWKLVIGSAYKGSFDGYYGSSGQDPSTPPYNASSVVESQAGRAIRETFTLLYKPSTVEPELQVLRSRATVRCTNSLQKRPFPGSCNPALGSGPCLYYLPNDPCEERSLSAEQPVQVRSMRQLLVQMKGTLVRQLNEIGNPILADPKRFNNTWTFWGDGDA